jgi:hypothetical protein
MASQQLQESSQIQDPVLQEQQKQIEQETAMVIKRIKELRREDRMKGVVVEPKRRKRSSTPAQLDKPHSPPCEQKQDQVQEQEIEEFVAFADGKVVSKETLEEDENPWEDFDYDFNGVEEHLEPESDNPVMNRRIFFPPITKRYSLQMKTIQKAVVLAITRHGTGGNEDWELTFPSAIAKSLANVVEKACARADETGCFEHRDPEIVKKYKNTSIWVHLKNKEKITGSKWQAICIVKKRKGDVPLDIAIPRRQGKLLVNAIRNLF